MLLTLTLILTLTATQTESAKDPLKVLAIVFIILVNN